MTAVATLDPAYVAFLASKAPKPAVVGFDPDPFPHHLFDYQRATTDTALRAPRVAAPRSADARAAQPFPDRRPIADAWTARAGRGDVSSLKLGRNLTVPAVFSKAAAWVTV